MTKANSFIVKGSTAIMLCPGPKRTLASVLLDVADLPAVLAAGRWRVANFFPKGFRLYAYISTYVGNGKSQLTYLHRFIAQPQPGLVVDHINHRGTDNRRTNLRCVTHRENTKNLSPDAHARTCRALEKARLVLALRRKEQVA